MISGLGLENFKAFSEKQYLPFKKINVLLGPNSSGKSSYLKGLLLLNESIKNKEEQPALDLNVEIGDYKSIVYGKNSKKRIGFSVSFDETKHLNEEDIQNIKLENRSLFILTSLTSEKNRQISLTKLNSFIKEILKEYQLNPIKSIEFSVKQTLKRPNMVHHMKLIFKNEEVLEIGMERNTYYLYKGDYRFSQPNIITPYKFLFRIDEWKFQQSKEKEYKDLLLINIALSHIESHFEQFFRSFIRLEPFRNKPSRSELIANFKFNSVGSDGSNTLSTVIGMNQNVKEHNMQSVKSKVNYWLHEFDLAEAVEAEELKNNQYSLIIKNKFTGIRSNIMDVGVGTSQLLPIIVETFLSPQKSVLMIEEPETHIHPNAQSKLAEMFATCIKEEEKRFFIETHSMYFVQKLQILIARGELNINDVGIFYFRQTSEGSKIEELELEDNGQFKEEFPDGFFDVAFKLSKQFMEAMY